MAPGPGPVAPLGPVRHTPRAVKPSLPYPAATLRSPTPRSCRYRSPRSLPTPLRLPPHRPRVDERQRQAGAAQRLKVGVGQLDQVGVLQGRRGEGG